MSLKNNGILNIGTYNDNSREYHIDARGKGLAEVIRAIDARDIEPVENLACSEKDQASAAKDSPNKTAKNDEILPIPKKGKYTQVRKYIEERCKFDNDFKTYVERNSRVELCIYLTDLFGWDVDPHHLGVNMNRHR